MLKLTFMGANLTVTGSRHLLECNQHRVLVDCGLFQGDKDLRERNWQPFPVDPASIDCLLLTHAHIDHSGWIPRLMNEGFSGPVYCTKATEELSDLLLQDSGHIQEDDATRANLHGYSRHSPALPLFTQEDAIRALRFFKTLNYNKVFSPVKGLDVSFSRAGHILGSAYIVAKCEGKTILFSGDIGRQKDPIMNSPATPPADVDYIVLESTYGDRLHKDVNPMIEMQELIQGTINRGGTVVFPAFAVGRTQSLLYYLHELVIKKQIPRVPIYLDSPMAIDATKFLCEYPEEHRLSVTECPLIGKTAIYTQSVEASKAISARKEPCIIISASGMATGGRVLHHLKNYLPDPNSCVIFTGFQAAETRGRLLLDGIKELKIHGESVSVRASIADLDNMSAHADYGEMLTWLEGIKSKPKKVFLVHGEKTAAASFAEKIKAKFGWDVVIPKHLESVVL